MNIEDKIKECWQEFPYKLEYLFFTGMQNCKSDFNLMVRIRNEKIIGCSSDFKLDREEGQKIINKVYDQYIGNTDYLFKKCQIDEPFVLNCMLLDVNGKIKCIKKAEDKYLFILEPDINSSQFLNINQEMFERFVLYNEFPEKIEIEEKSKRIKI